MPRRRYAPPSDIEPLFHFCRHCGGDYTPQEGGIERVCPECAQRLYTRCDECGATIPAADARRPSSGRTLCRSCATRSATPAAGAGSCTSGPRPTSSSTPTARPYARRAGTTGRSARNAGSTSPQTTSKRERTPTRCSAAGAPRGEEAGSSTPTRTSRSRYSIAPRERARAHSRWESSWRWTEARRNGRRGASSRSRGATISTSSGTRASRTVPNSSRTR